MKSELSEKWIKASIIGTIWAASEIVFGSFLHNLKVPFCGNILTAIGVIILISVSYRWREKGLFWRAGLICAIMKTMSPSAVIFGPMIAIFSESLLLELFVRLFGCTIPGFLLGSMAAMSWNLFQKIANYIIFYGAGIVDVYTNLLHMAQKQLHWQTDIVWLPIIILFVIDLVFGLISGIIGIRVGKRSLTEPAEIQMETGKQITQKQGRKPDQAFNYSILWLMIDFLMMIGAFFLLNKTSWMVWSLSITAMVTVWSLRYKRALRQLSKPKFWISFVIITLITAIVFTKVQTGENVLKSGLLAGVQMNFRAVVIILGFAVLGTELYNPKIRNFFMGTSFKHLPLAIELSVNSLPTALATIPDFKSIIRNPVQVFSRFIANAENRLLEIRNKPEFCQKVFIINGSVNQGKTSFTKKLIDIFKKNNVPVAGFLSEKVVENARMIGYNLVDIETNSTEVLLRETEENDPGKIGRFAIHQAGFDKGKTLLSPNHLSGNELVIIDEVGALEINDKGWATSIDQLIEASHNHLLLIVRDSLTDQVIKKWNFPQSFVYPVANFDYVACSQSIMDEIKNQK